MLCGAPLAACSDEAQPTRPPFTSSTAGSSFGNAGTSGYPGPGQAGSTSTVTCSPRDDCTCADGRVGDTICTGNVASCQCDNCPTYEEPTPPAFDACGGNLAGYWQSDELQGSAIDFRLYRRQGGSYFFAGTCAAQLGSAEYVTPMRIRANAVEPTYGVLEIATGPLAVSLSLLEDCVEDALQVSCSQLEVSGTCKEACGVCDCVLGGAAFSEINVIWSSGDGTFDLFDSSMSYCVTGDQLQVMSAEGFVTTLHRVYPFAQPAACAERTTEASCVSGCTWASGACTGTPLRCELTDYGVVPGCELQAMPQVCTGTQPACSTHQSADCLSAPGCEVGSACVGGAVNCSHLTGSCDFCEGVTGCTYCAQGSGSCGGTSTCAAQTSKFSCEDVARFNMGTCTWTPDLCVGTPLPCSEITPENCAATPGCSLQ